MLKKEWRKEALRLRSDYANLNDNYRKLQVAVGNLEALKRDHIDEISRLRKAIDQQHDCRLDDMERTIKGLKREKDELCKGFISYVSKTTKLLK